MGPIPKGRNGQEVIGYEQVGKKVVFRCADNACRFGGRATLPVHVVDDDIYAKAVDKFGETGVVDLIAVSGYYDVVSMTLNVAHVAPPKDAQLPFKQAGR